MSTRRKERKETFFALDTEPPVGVWFAIVNRKIVATGKSAREVYNIAHEKYPEADIYIARLPESSNMLL